MGRGIKKQVLQVLEANIEDINETTMPGRRRSCHSGVKPSLLVSIMFLLG